jgi:hypothetical protein
MNYIKILYFLEGISCLLFYYFSAGLIFFDEQRKSYELIRSLNSSGGDDDLAIFLVGCFCFVAFIITLLRKYSVYYMLLIVILTSIFQLLSLTLIEVGSLYATIFHGANVYLAAVVTLQITIFIIMIKEIANISLRSTK